MTEAFPPPQLPLEFPTYDHYTVSLSKGAIGEMETLRSFDAKTDEDALNLIEGLRDTYSNRDNVTWQVQDMPDNGTMYGLAPHGVVYEILVVPTLGTIQ